ncbi:MAG: hypothetical protein ACYC0H_24155 [Solirubrobacteraceae bacterium]
MTDTSGSGVFEPVLNLSLASPSSTRPVDINLLGVVATTRNLQFQRLAQPGRDQVIESLVDNASHLVDGGLLSVQGLLNNLGVGAAAPGKRREGRFLPSLRDWHAFPFRNPEGFPRDG